MKVTPNHNRNRLNLWDAPATVTTASDLITEEMKEVGTVMYLGDRSDRQVSIDFPTSRDLDTATALAEQLGATVTEERPPATGRYA